MRRDTRVDLTSKPKLEAGCELKRLSDRPARVHDAEDAVRWGEVLDAWHVRWRDLIAERTYAGDDPSNPRASRREWWWTHERLRRCYRHYLRRLRDSKR